MNLKLEKYFAPVRIICRKTCRLQDSAASEFLFIAQAWRSRFCEIINLESYSSILLKQTLKEIRYIFVFFDQALRLQGNINISSNQYLPVDNSLKARYTDDIQKGFLT